MALRKAQFFIENTWFFIPKPEAQIDHNLGHLAKNTFSVTELAYFDKIRDKLRLKS